MDDTQTAGNAELRIDIENLSDENLAELSRLVVRKLRESMRQERDRSGRY